MLFLHFYNLKSKKRFPIVELEVWLVYYRSWKYIKKSVKEKIYLPAKDQEKKSGLSLWCEWEQVARGLRSRELNTQPGMKNKRKWKENLSCDEECYHKTRYAVTLFIKSTLYI